ncbi:hypothetical protein FRAHR75_240031 [Frankia sp. Hr75.2]|nr:hypothetical protein FRAHR75_240031 [Frankia sp. Hr75.2]SQD98407.1 hypothetical protein FMEAI12_4640005 [Parafrankia sp. Ea1.12]
MALEVRVVVGAGQPGRELLDGVLELRVQVDEGAQSVGERVERHRFLAAAGSQLLDAPVGEVHGGKVSVPTLRRPQRGPAVSRARSKRARLTAECLLTGMRPAGTGVPAG